MIRTKKLPH